MMRQQVQRVRKNRIFPIYKPTLTLPSYMPILSATHQGFLMLRRQTDKKIAHTWCMREKKRVISQECGQWQMEVTKTEMDYTLGSSQFHRTGT